MEEVDLTDMGEGLECEFSCRQNWRCAKAHFSLTKEEVCDAVIDSGEAA